MIAVCPDEPAVFPPLGKSGPSLASMGVAAVPIWSPVAVVKPQLVSTPIRLCPSEVGAAPSVEQSGVSDGPLVLPAMSEFRRVSLLPKLMPPPRPAVVELPVTVMLSYVLPLAELIAPPAPTARLPEKVSLTKVSVPPLTAPPWLPALLLWNVLPLIVKLLPPTAPPSAAPPVVELLSNRLFVIEPPPAAMAPPLPLVAMFPEKTLLETVTALANSAPPPVTAVLFTNVLLVIVTIPLIAPPLPSVELAVNVLLVTVTFPSIAPPLPVAWLFENVLLVTVSGALLKFSIAPPPPPAAVLFSKTERFT